MESCDIIYITLNHRREGRLGYRYTGRSNRNSQVRDYTVLYVFDPPMDENRDAVRSKSRVVLNIEFKAKGHDLDCR